MASPGHVSEHSHLSYISVSAMWWYSLLHLYGDVATRHTTTRAQPGGVGRGSPYTHPAENSCFAGSHEHRPSILGPADLSGSYASPTTPDTRAERQHPA